MLRVKRTTHPLHRILHQQLGESNTGLGKLRLRLLYRRLMTEVDCHRTHYQYSHRKLD